MSIKIDGESFDFQDGMTILQVINAFKIEHPQICYLPEVDPIETCDTCIVEVDGNLLRACSTKAVSGMSIHFLHHERKKRRQKRWTGFSKIICSIVRYVTTTMATVKYIIR